MHWLHKPIKSLKFYYVFEMLSAFDLNTCSLYVERFTDMFIAYIFHMHILFTIVSMYLAH